MTDIQMMTTDRSGLASVVRTAWAEGSWVREAWERAHAERAKAAPADRWVQLFRFGLMRPEEENARAVT